MVYFSYFQSHISLSINILGSLSDATRVFRMQKKEVRMITKSIFKNSSRENLKIQNSLHFPSLYIFNCLLSVHLYLNDIYNGNIIHNSFARNLTLLQCQIYRTIFFEMSSRYSSLMMFNSLPNRIRE